MQRSTIACGRWRLAFLCLVISSLPTASWADTVYALSNNDGRVIRYDSTNPAGSVVTLSSSGAIVLAAGMAIGPDGNLYIGESGDYSTVAPAIKRLNLTNNSLSTVYSFSTFNVFPGALVFKGNDLLVGRNPFFGDTGPVVKLSNATGGSVSLSDYTTGGSLASSPGLAFGPDGSLYVSDQTYSFEMSEASGPVLRFDASGQYVGEVVADGVATGLSGPTGLGIRGTTLYTASIMNGAVLKTNLLDDSTTSFGTTGVPFGASPLALLADGGLIVGSAGGAGDIYRFNSVGLLVETYNSGLGTIGGLVAVPVPEPASIVTAMIGAAGAMLCLRRRVGSRS